jgi:hypothetical protein
VPAKRRVTFTDHELRSKDDAENLLLQLEQGPIRRFLHIVNRSHRYAGQQALPSPLPSSW